jgi:hypothetical protein
MSTKATWPLRRILLPEIFRMKVRPAHAFLLLLLGAILLSASGCATDDPENTTVRPWNAPQGWEKGTPMYDSGQHR